MRKLETEHIVTIVSVAAIPLLACNSRGCAEPGETPGDEAAASAAGVSTLKDSASEPPSQGKREPSFVDCLSAAQKGYFEIIGLQRDFDIEKFWGETNPGSPELSHLADGAEFASEMIAACESKYSLPRPFSVKVVDEEAAGLRSAKVEMHGGHGLADSCTADDDGVCKLEIAAIFADEVEVSLSAFYQKSQLNLLRSPTLGTTVGELLDQPITLELTTESERCVVEVLDANNSLLLDISKITVTHSKSLAPIEAVEDPDEKGTWIYDCPKRRTLRNVTYRVTLDGEVQEFDDKRVELSRTLHWPGPRRRGGRREPPKKTPKAADALPPCSSDKATKTAVRAQLASVTNKPPDCDMIEVVVRGSKIVEPRWLHTDLADGIGVYIDCQEVVSCEP